jgi:hypothetical protein
LVLHAYSLRVDCFYAITLLRASKAFELLHANSLRVDCFYAKF